jgi:hypothetical protein
MFPKRKAGDSRSPALPDGRVIPVVFQCVNRAGEVSSPQPYAPYGATPSFPIHYSKTTQLLVQIMECIKEIRRKQIITSGTHHCSGCIYLVGNKYGTRS